VLNLFWWLRFESSGFHALRVAAVREDFQQQRRRESFLVLLAMYSQKDILKKIKVLKQVLLKIFQ
jgi:hypothetical protein